MEYIGFALLGVLIFLLGWVTGNAVEWLMNAQERRITEAKIAEYNKQMFFEERQERE
jgi:hypothetical protein